MSDMDTAALLAAVLESRDWLAQFTRAGYKGAVRAYKARFGPLYLKAVRETGGAGLSALAASLLDGMEAAWARERPWNRSLARVNSQQMLVQYLSPMLLELAAEEPDCGVLAESLRDGWAARRPKEAYRIASAENIQKGFRLTVLGFPVPDGFLGSGREEREE